MAITLAQFKASLGKLADGLSDEEIQKRLDFTYRFAEGFYEWFSVRKGTGVEAITGAYVNDAMADSERDAVRIKAMRKAVHLLPEADAELKQEAKKHEQRYPYKN
ncbi:MAG: hypothetical protein AAB458_01620 [Patescibacteria group bacterium]